VKTRILFLINTGDFGGAERHLLELIRRLDSSRAHSTILCYGPDFYSQRLIDRPDVQVVSPTRVTPNSFLRYWSTFLRFRPQVIVFVKGSMDSFPLIAYVAARLAGTRRLIAIEQLIAEGIPSRPAGRGLWTWLRRLVGWRTRHLVTYVWMKRLAERFLTKTICVSTAVRDRLIEHYGYPRDKTVTIRNGVDVGHFDLCENRRQNTRRSLALAPPDVTFLCLARLVRRKRVDIVLEALAMVSRKHPTCRCLIVGCGPLEDELRAKSRELGLSESVRFLGFSEDVRPYLEAADVYVSASENEGLPLALVEAMACGLPTVVTDISGHSEAVLHGRTGFLVPPSSVDALAEALEYLVVHRDEARRMGINARERVVECFNNDRSMKDIERILLHES
jgi:glycosyltransferase involved in cell wall biosynthesis